jgi:hypothetical protein
MYNLQLLKIVMQEYIYINFFPFLLFKLLFTENENISNVSIIYFLNY